MGDVCLAIKEMLRLDGEDHNLLTPAEVLTNDYDRLTYTDSGKMILRQFEATSADAKQFSLFVQEKGNTTAYLLFQIQMVLQWSKAEYFGMASSKLCCHLALYSCNQSTNQQFCYYISHSTILSDLCSRKNNAICVLQEGATLSIEETAKYHEVVEIHKLIATYHDKYANDLSHCLEIDKCHLPSAYTFMALLNPMFGLEWTKYSHAREALLRSMQDEFDEKDSVLLIPSDSNNSNSLDGTLDYLENDNYHLGEK